MNEKPEVQLEAPKLSGIAEIKARLEAMKKSVVDSKQKWEDEKASLAKEIVDMMDGNVALKSKLEQDRNTGNLPPRADEEMRNEINRKISTLHTQNEQIEKKHTNDLAEIQSIRLESQNQEKKAEGDASRAEFQQLLADLDTQESEIEKTYKTEKEELEYRSGGFMRMENEIAHKYDKFEQGQSEVARNPLKFAKETVFSAHDIASEKQPEVEHLVDVEIGERKLLEEIEKDLPILEKRATDTESALNTFENDFSVNSSRARDELAALKEDLDGPVAHDVSVYQGQIKKLNEPGLFGFLSSKKVAGEQMKAAKDSINSIKKELLERTSNIHRNIIAPMGDIYYIVSETNRGHLEDRPTYDRSTEISKLQWWIKYTEANPTAPYAKYTDKIKELVARYQSTEERRIKLAKDTNKAINELGSIYSELTHRISTISSETL